jgi:hypothetical protein
MRLGARLELMHRSVSAALNHNLSQQAASVLAQMLELLAREFEIHHFRRVSRVLDLHCHGFRILHSETGFRVELASVSCHFENLRHFENKLNVLETRLAERTVVERCVVSLQKFVSRVLLCELSLGSKRVLLSILNTWRSALCRLLKDARAQNGLSIDAIGSALHEPERRARVLLREHAYYFDLNFAKRVEGHRHRDVATSKERFHWPDQMRYRQWVAANPGSRVLLTIHMGDFMGAFKCLASQNVEERHVVSLQRDTGAGVMGEHELGLGLRQQVWQHGTDSALDITVKLRRGSCTLATFFDLREAFGETTQVRFFGRLARLVKGPALLAVTGKAPIIPFVTFEVDGIDCIELQAPVDSRPHTGETLEQTVDRITATLAVMAEKWIRRFPSQWKYLPFLGGYFSDKTGSPS